MVLEYMRTKKEKSGMAKIDPALEKELKSKPKANFDVIVRVQGDLGARQAELETLGLRIRQRLRLVKGFGATGAGSTLVRVLEVDWIISIEPDKTVHTM